MISRNAYGNLKNRYVSVLKKCRLMNLFGNIEKAFRGLKNCIKPLATVALSFAITLTCFLDQSFATFVFPADQVIADTTNNVNKVYSPVVLEPDDEYYNSGYQNVYQGSGELTINRKRPSVMGENSMYFTDFDTYLKGDTALTFKDVYFSTTGKFIIGGYSDVFVKGGSLLNFAKKLTINSTMRIYAGNINAPKGVVLRKSLDFNCGHIDTGDAEFELFDGSHLALRYVDYPLTKISTLYLNGGYFYPTSDDTKFTVDLLKGPARYGLLLDQNKGILVNAIDMKNLPLQIGATYGGMSTYPGATAQFMADGLSKDKLFFNGDKFIVGDKIKNACSRPYNAVAWLTGVGGTMEAKVGFQPYGIIAVDKNAHWSLSKLNLNIEDKTGIEKVNVFGTLSLDKVIYGDTADNTVLMNLENGSALITPYANLLTKKSSSTGDISFALNDVINNTTFNANGAHIVFTDLGTVSQDTAKKVKETLDACRDTQSNGNLFEFGDDVFSNTHETSLDSSNRLLISEMTSLKTKVNVDASTLNGNMTIVAPEQSFSAQKIALANGDNVAKLNYVLDNKNTVYQLAGTGEGGNLIGNENLSANIIMEKGANLSLGAYHTSEVKKGNIGDILFDNGSGNLIVTGSVTDDNAHSEFNIGTLKNSCCSDYMARVSILNNAVAHIDAIAFENGSGFTAVHGAIAEVDMLKGDTSRTIVRDGNLGIANVSSVNDFSETEEKLNSSVYIGTKGLARFGAPLSESDQGALIDTLTNMGVSTSIDPNTNRIKIQDDHKNVVLIANNGKTLKLGKDGNIIADNEVNSDRFFSPDLGISAQTVKPYLNPYFELGVASENHSIGGAYFGEDSHLVVDAKNFVDTGNGSVPVIDGGGRDIFVDETSKLGIYNGSTGDLTVLKNFNTKDVRGVYRDRSDIWDMNDIYTENSLLKVTEVKGDGSEENPYIVSLTKSLEGGGDINFEVDPSNPNPDEPTSFLDTRVEPILTAIPDEDYEVDSPNPGIDLLYNATNKSVGTTKEQIAAMEGAGQILAISGGHSNIYGASTSATNAVNSRNSFNADVKVQTLPDNKLALWITPFYEYEKVDGRDSWIFETGHESNMRGLAIGADYTYGVDSAKPMLDESVFRVGGAFNIGSGNSHSIGDFLPTYNDYHFWGVNLYGAMQRKNLTLIASLGYVHSDNDVTQDVSRLGMTNLKADASLEAYSVGVKAEYKFLVKDFELIPYAGLNYIAIAADNYNIYSDKGLAFSVEDYRQDLVTAPVGVSLAKDFVYKNCEIRPEVYAGATIAMGDIKTISYASIPQVNATASLDTEVLDRVTFDTGASLKIEKGNIGFALDYGFKASEHRRSHSVSVSLIFEF